MSFLNQFAHSQIKTYYNLKMDSKLNSLIPITCDRSEGVADDVYKAVWGNFGDFFESSSFKKWVKLRFGNLFEDFFLFSFSSEHVIIIETFIIDKNIVSIGHYKFSVCRIF